MEYVILIGIIGLAFGTYHVINSERIYQSAKKQLKQLENEKHGIKN